MKQCLKTAWQCLNIIHDSASNLAISLQLSVYLKFVSGLCMTSCIVGNLTVAQCLQSGFGLFSSHGKEKPTLKVKASWRFGNCSPSKLGQKAKVSRTINHCLNWLPPFTSNGIIPNNNNVPNSYYILLRNLFFILEVIFNCLQGWLDTTFGWLWGVH